MGLIAVPNVSEGRDEGRIRKLSAVVEDAGCTILDTHSDAVHHRTVFTVAGEDDRVVDGMTRLACAARAIDLRAHDGVHPRLGVLDVCPFVPHEVGMADAVAAARSASVRIARECIVPVYLYGEAAARAERRELPEVRRRGAIELEERGFEPDHGPEEIDPAIGVVCVGARDFLIAFNVWIEGSPSDAKKIAATIRTANGGPPGIRALGLALGEEVSQVSMNLIDPWRTGIDDAFEATRMAALERGVRITSTEIVGLPPERFLPDPRKEAARLLMKPGRSLESALSAV